jgi:hypothetical protein
VIISSDTSTPKFDVAVVTVYELLLRLLSLLLLLVLLVLLMLG